MASVATDLYRAKTFHRDSLGLSLVSEDSFALVFNANGTMLRLAIVKGSSRTALHRSGLGSARHRGRSERPALLRCEVRVLSAIHEAG